MAPPHPSTSPRLYDLDTEAGFQTCLDKLKDPNLGNFAVHFDRDSSNCATDISEDEAVAYVDADRRPANKTVWLCFWAIESQRSTIAAIAKKYDLSPRLTSLLCPTKPSPGVPPKDSALNRPVSDSTNSSSAPIKPPAAADVEMGPVPALDAGNRQQNPPALQGITFGDVVDDLWHFCSVDFGRHYIYLGFNALFSIPDAHSNDDKPSGERIWTSLLLCDDGTVVSVFERPSSRLPEATSITRRNLRNVFRHLSKVHDRDGNQDALMKVRIRWNERTSGPQSAYPKNEAPSLLFYYLFDDWLTTYTLIARKANPYRRQLDDLKQKMIDKAELGLVQSIHQLGRQLTVLKLMYQSYELIVTRLLSRQRAARDATLLSAVSPLTRANTQDTSLLQQMSLSQSQVDFDDFWDEDGPAIVKLSLSAVVRFERLLGWIRLYALTEIEECLKEKESLVFMNFNLVALKESQAVERLTRTTILLAKATILFLPVSLMTGYFSIQLPEISEIYTLTTYWWCFFVVMVLSILFLVIFGLTTHTIEGKTIYRSITRIILDQHKKKKTH